jgi:CHAT domain-containing protein
MHNNGTATYQYIYSNGPTGGASLTLVSSTSAYGPASTVLALCGNGWVYAYQQYGGPTYWTAMVLVGNYSWAI